MSVPLAARQRPYEVVAVGMPHGLGGACHVQGRSEELFTVLPQQLAVEAARDYWWSIYVIRVDLTSHDQAPAIKIGIGTGTIGDRLGARRSLRRGRSAPRLGLLAASELTQLTLRM
jgi:hypothetical protein